MSWDVLIMRVPDGIKKVDDLPDEYDHDLSALADLLPRLRTIFPFLDLSDPTWVISRVTTFRSSSVSEKTTHVRQSCFMCAAAKVRWSPSDSCVMPGAGRRLIPVRASSLISLDPNRRRG